MDNDVSIDSVDRMYRIFHTVRIGTILRARLIKETETLHKPICNTKPSSTQRLASLSAASRTPSSFHSEKKKIREQEKGGDYG